ncbi:MAG: hypothetical protein E6G06_04360 [Actinobacteria bacterium]|nr:MAG: hypothetical protein E6G06_04360 [Actinomycetota bacterium]
MDSDLTPDLTDLERELCRLPEVNAARIVTDQVGRPTEVHILASPAKHAKQVARDVQSVAMASFGLDLDRRIISVVQLDGGQLDAAAAIPGPPAAEPRVVIGGISSEQNGLRTLVRVTLQRGETEGAGFAEGSIAASARPRLVAQATLDALRQLLPAAECADVEIATVVRVGTREVALASMVFVIPPHEDVVSGSALVRGANETEAVARAVLDATNRRLPQLH